MRERICVDQDGVLADLITCWVDRYNNIYEDDLKATDIITWDWHELTKCGKKIYELIKDPTLFENLPVIQDSQMVLEKLCKQYDVYIVTASRNAEIIPAKSRWLRKHFPFIKKDKHVFAVDKSICLANYLIDDSVKNLNVFKGIPLMFDAPHNQSETGFARMKNWKEIATFFGV